MNPDHRRLSDGAIWLRPEQSSLGRPARHSRSAITVAAVRIGDLEGLAAVTMRSVAAALGTGAASLYRHVADRDELVDLMVDHVAAEYDLSGPSGDWLGDLIGIAKQGLVIHRAHPWLADVLATPVIGPNGLALTEQVLAVLADHPASDGDKLVAYAVLNALVTAFARTEYGTDPDRARAQASYLAHVVADGGYPHLAALATEGPADLDALFPEVVRRTLRGLLAP